VFAWIILEFLENILYYLGTFSLVFSLAHAWAKIIAKVEKKEAAGLGGENAASFIPYVTGPLTKPMGYKFWYVLREKVL